MRLAVVGSRTFTDYSLLCRWMGFMLRGIEPEDIEIVSGGACGADSLAERYALADGLAYKEFPADWHRNGRRAGFIRNREIVLRAERVLAFWDGCSAGTKHTINLATSMQKPVVVVGFKTEVCETTPLFDWSC